MSSNLAISIHFSSLAAQLALLAAGPFSYRKAIGATTIVALAIIPHFLDPVSQIPGDAQPFSLLWPIYLGTLDKLLCASDGKVEETYWRVDRKIREATAFKRFSLRKLKWCAALMFNTRGIRWNYEVKKLPPKPHVPKFEFLARQIVDFAKLLLMTDLLLQLSERLFWIDPVTGAPHVESKHLTITHPDWRWSLFRVASFAAGPYFFVNLQYVTVSIIAVSLNLSKPEDWPPYFGSLNEVTTVRHFWGTFWHQTLRRTWTELTGYLVDLFKIQRGSNTSAYAQIWIAFFASGIMHAQSMLLLPFPAEITLSERSTGIMAFFVWQALAITLEDIAQWMWKKTISPTGKKSQMTTVIGYIWVIMSFWISLPWAADVMMRVRLTEKSFLGFTVMRGLVQKLPIS